MEVTETLRLCLQKAHEWSMSLVVAQADVHKAFDSMIHEKLVHGYLYRETPRLLILAVMRELACTTMTFALDGTVTDCPVPHEKGGKQGGSGTPEDWNTYVNQ
eukprot:11164373-Karenia_brevis.AAC.1